MSAASDIEVQSTELLRTLIRNGCVNTGEASSGHEDRSCAALEDFFAGSGLSCERYTSSPGRMSLITRIEGSDCLSLFISCSSPATRAHAIESSARA